MAVQQVKSRLQTDITRALSARGSRGAQVSDERSGQWLLMTGMALAILQSPAADALSLGELRVESAIGEPLAAGTTVRLAEGERLSNSCISLPTTGTDGFQNPAGIRVAAVEAVGPGEYPIRVRTRTPLYEPMYEIKLQVQCAGSVAMTRSYVVMLDLPVASLAAPQTGAPPAALPRRSQAGRRPAPARAQRTPALAPAADPIAPGSLYRVRSGDTLSDIAERVAERPAGSLWDVADLLFNANPDAFVGGDPDLLKLGSMLYIPEPATLALGGPPEPEAVGTSTPVEADTPPPAATGVAAAVAVADPAMENDPAAENTVQEAPEPLLFGAAYDAQRDTEARDAAASPFAEDAAPAAATPAADGGAADRDQEPPPVSRTLSTTETTELNPLFAVLAGMLLGVLLAIAIVGRNLLGALTRREHGTAAPAAAAPRPSPQPVQDTQRLSREAPDPLNYTRAGIDVQLTPAADTSVDIDLSEAAGSSAESAPTPRPSRISLHNPENEFADLLDELAATSEVSAGYTEGEQPVASSTIRDLFATLTPADQQTTEPMETLSAAAEEPTAKMPHMNTDELAAQDLQTLSHQADATGNDRLSATLTQALELLEKDYEDELSTSQRLDKDEIAAAFAEHDRKRQ